MNCLWMDESIDITNCHCPSSAKRSWELSARSAVLPNMFKLVGLKPFNDWGGGAVELAAWISGGDLNLGENTIRNEMKNTPATQR